MRRKSTHGLASAGAPGQVVRLIADDPMAAIDVPHFCVEGGHRMIAKTVEGPANVFYVAKG